MTRRLYRSITLRALSTLLIGALIIAFPLNATKYLVMSIGLLFLVPGVVSMLTYFIHRHKDKVAAKKEAEEKEDEEEEKDEESDKKEDKKEDKKNQTPYFPTIGLGSSLFGLLLLAFPSSFKDILVYLLGVFAVVAALVQAVNTYKLGKVYKTSPAMYVISALIGLAGVVVIYLNHYVLTTEGIAEQKPELMTVPALIAGIALVVYGLSETAYALYFRKPATIEKEESDKEGIEEEEKEDNEAE